MCGSVIFGKEAVRSRRLGYSQGPLAKPLLLDYKQFFGKFWIKIYFNQIPLNTDNSS